MFPTQQYDTEFYTVREDDLASRVVTASAGRDDEQLDEAEYNYYNHLSRLSAENYEPDVTSVNERCANIFWRGGYKGGVDGVEVTPTITRRTDTVLTLNGLKLYPGWYRDTDRTYTYWIDNENNLRYVLTVDRDNLVISCWFNRKSKDGRWRGFVVISKEFGSAYKDSTEQAALLWLISDLDTATAGAVNKTACCAVPQVKTNLRGTRQWCTSCRSTWTV